MASIAGILAAAVLFSRGTGFGVCASVCIEGVKGDGAGQMNGPGGVAVDGAGDVYVADPGNHRVQKFGEKRKKPRRKR